MGRHIIKVYERYNYKDTVMSLVRPGLCIADSWGVIISHDADDTMGVVQLKSDSLVPDWLSNPRSTPLSYPSAFKLMQKFSRAFYPVDTVQFVK